MTAQERKRLAKARKVKRARDLLQTVMTGDRKDDDLYCACVQLERWISGLPAVVRAALEAGAA